MSKLINKYILNILLPISLSCMESENIDIPKEVGEIVADITSSSLIEDTLRLKPIVLSENPSRKELNKSAKKIIEMFNHRANLLSVSKGVLSEKTLIDAKVLEVLKQQDKRLLAHLFSRLYYVKNINNKLMFADFLDKAGAIDKFMSFIDPNKILWVNNAEQLFTQSGLKQAIIEAVKKEDTRWLEFLFKNGLKANHQAGRKFLPLGFAERYPLTKALNLVKTHPKGSLKVVKLLLNRGADPLIDVHYWGLSSWLITPLLPPYTLILSPPATDNIYSVYSPKRELTLKNKKLVRDYSSPEAEEIKKLLRDRIKNEPLNRQKNKLSYKILGYYGGAKK
ncbi:hypothetical protein M1446_03650 [Candidatus Dependentiae bacterium]|nr:hypothetical protein [Candidatus Dependentiae bacterium]